jgi:hypothetical protein
MACWICEDSPTAGVDMEEGGTEVEDLFVGLVEVRDINVQMKLLRMRDVRPLRRAVIRHPLEPEHEARGGVKARKVVADCPPGIGLVDDTTEERLIEKRKFQRIRAVQNHALQLADHNTPQAVGFPALTSHRLAQR